MHVRDLSADIFVTIYPYEEDFIKAGFGYGEMTGGPDKFAMLHPVAKWLLAFEMMVGRLEVFTVLVLFTPSFWKKD